MTSRLVVTVLAGLLMASAPSVSAETARSADTAPALPAHTAVVAAARRAADYYRPTYATTTLAPHNGWSWSTYDEGLVDLWRHTGDGRYLADALAWGSSNAWQPATGEANPDTVKSGQVYAALHAVSPTVPLAPMDAQMATDLTGLPLSQYDWIDSLFMGLPDWASWAQRTGDPAYLDKMDALFAWNRDQGGTSSRCAGRHVPQTGLYDATSGLWWRDCRFVGSPDANGRPVFWSRGNGWVAAAMADVLRTLPAGSSRGAPYADMLRSMAARLAPLQGSDGLWRASLLDAPFLPAPETSGTALITYALAAGIRTGVLDGATYGPVVARAWQGLTTVALQPSGFLSGCQGPGTAPGPAYTAAAPASSGSVNADSPPYCVGAFLMAAAEVAQLSPDLAAGRPVTSTAGSGGHPVTGLVDGDVTTGWASQGFPQRARVDLGSVRTVGSVMLVPDHELAYRFRIETSTDGVRWRLLVDRSGRAASRLAERITWGQLAGRPTRSVPGTQLVDVAPRQARYVRLTVLGATGATTPGSSLSQLSVYAP